MDTNKGSGALFSFPGDHYCRATAAASTTTNPPPSSRCNIRVISQHPPSWNLGLGSCFGAIHRLSWSDLWMIKFVHCQSPFLPGTNTSDIGAKERRRSWEWPACCWVTWPHRGAFMVLLLKLGKMTIKPKISQAGSISSTICIFQNAYK